jgi:hypothetical protein
MWLTLAALGLMSASAVLIGNAMALTTGIATVNPYNPVISPTPITVTLGGGTLNVVRDPMAPPPRSAFQP